MDYENLLQTPLSNDDITKLFKMVNDKANIIFLPELKGITTIDGIFKGFDHAIIFVATSAKTDGHWQLLLRTDDSILFFDSYGHNFTVLLKKVFEYFGENAWGESYKLGKLVVDSKIPSIMNTVEYQGKNSHISTCGRHCVVCFMFFKETPNFTFDLYHSFIQNSMKQFGLPNADFVVCRITENMLSS